MNPLEACLLISAGIFTLGLAAALTRSNAIVVLLGIELMLNAANLNVIAFWQFSHGAGTVDAPVFVLFTFAVAAAEAAVGLALIIALHRHRRHTRLQEEQALKG